MVNITVNTVGAPTVLLTAPTEGAIFVSPATVSLAATANDTDGTVAKVEFYQGVTKIGEDLTDPFTLDWNVTPTGNYALTAVATDNLGNVSVASNVRNIVVNPNTPPTVAISSPTNNASLALGDPILITVTASDTETSVNLVEFYDGATLLGSDANSPFEYTFSGAAAGSHSLTAKAFDTAGASTTSAVITVTVSGPIPVSATGTGTLTFGTLPAASQWSTFSVPGTNTDIQNSLPADMDTAMSATPQAFVTGGAITASQITTALVSKAASSTGVLAYWRSAGTSPQALCTQPTGNSMTLLMGTFKNTSGNTINELAVSYTLGLASVTGVADEIKGHRIYYSLTGAAGSWIAVGNQLITTGTTRDVSFLLSSTPLAWANNALLYLVFADDNGTSPDGDYTIDNFLMAPPLTRGPYLQMAAPTRMNIRWRTSSSSIGRVRYGTTVGTLDQTLDETAAPASPFNHEVALTGLIPNTTYFYSVGTATETFASGADYTFTTPPTVGTAQDTRIWVLGDAGKADANQRAVRDAFYNWTGTRTPNLVLQLGDNAYNTGLDAEFQKAMFDMYPTMLRKTPFWSCLGNHETGQSTSSTANFPYFDIYTMPTAGQSGGVASGTERYFSFNHGDIHFISLDSMTSNRSVDNTATTSVNEDGPMAAWLRNDLASTTATWIICFFHHPPYSKGSHGSDVGDTSYDVQMGEMRQRFLPILETGGVDLVLCGHSHAYERSYLLDGHYGLSSSLTAAMKLDPGDGRPLGTGAYIKPLTGPRDHFGAVYAVAGSSGQLSNWESGSSAVNNPNPHLAHFISLRRLGSMVLDINGARLDATFLREDGSTPDSFTIMKQGAADTDDDGLPDAYELANGLDRFTANETANPDSDAFDNFSEYAFGTNPVVSDSGELVYTGTLAGGGTMVRGGSQIIRIEGGANGADFRCLFARRKDDPGLTYIPEFSVDLAAWTPSTAVPVVLADDGTYQVVSVPFTRFINGKKARFFHVRASKP